ncbi:MAG TPA: OmpA family protein [bacterium]|jgi:outer membrane protein OmpA-like peptidoglycan-associated protein
MKASLRVLFGLALVLATVLPATAQYKDMGFMGGVEGGIVYDNNSDADARPGLHERASIACPLSNPFQLELGWGLGALLGKDMRTELIPIDLRLRFCPVHSARMIPFLYGGFGALHFDNSKSPAVTRAGTKYRGWTGVAPAGLGLEYLIDKDWSLEVRGGFNQSLSKDLNTNTKTTTQDSYFSGVLGLRIRLGAPNPDPDGDGLNNKLEKQLGTNPKNPDTDGDGLTDGDEYLKYHTDPLIKDTDTDGLTDGDEVLKYHTDPLKKDTDGDGLTDGDEVLQYKTDPLKADTDGDGLTDGDEVLKYHTDPLNKDSDGDKLTDGDEVLKYHTDPLKKDTDGGTVDDGTEVARGTDPLNPADDVPKIAITEVGKPIVLEGIVFRTNSAEILPASEKILNDAYETLRDNPKIEVAINGYTDATGSRDRNLKLSEARANSVKQWLVKKGIDEKRMTTRGFGPENPIGDNKTTEGKQKNRRIEFVRTK